MTKLLDRHSYIACHLARNLGVDDDEELRTVVEAARRVVTQVAFTDVAMTTSRVFRSVVLNAVRLTVSAARDRAGTDGLWRPRSAHGTGRRTVNPGVSVMRATNAPGAELWNT